MIEHDDCVQCAVHSSVMNLLEQGTTIVVLHGSCADFEDEGVVKTNPVASMNDGTMTRIP